MLQRDAKGPFTFEDLPFLFMYVVKGSLDEKLPSYEVLKMLKE